MRLSGLSGITVGLGYGFLLLFLASCSTHCGTFIHCDIPKGWPISDTFTVSSATNRICVRGGRRGSCFSKGMFQTGTQNFGIYLVGDDDEGDELITSVVLTGNPGDVFQVSCFEYNGRKRFGFTEILIGIEVSQGSAGVVAAYPAHPVTRRDSIVPTC